MIRAPPPSRARAGARGAGGIDDRFLRACRRCVRDTRVPGLYVSENRDGRTGCRESGSAGGALLLAAPDFARRTSNDDDRISSSRDAARDEHQVLVRNELGDLLIEDAHGPVAVLARHPHPWKSAPRRLALPDRTAVTPVLVRPVRIHVTRE